MSALPLFPLNTVFFPGGLLSLQLFEVRYLDMMQQCIQHQTRFGIVALTSGSEIRLPGKTETFYTLGTMVDIHEWSSPQTGLIQVVCEGTQRFQAHSIEQQRTGLWVAPSFDILADDKPIAIPDELSDTAAALENLLYSLKMQGRTEEELSIKAPYHFKDCGWVANRWAEILPMSIKDKQNLLALDNPLLRLELIQDALAEREMLR
jgi:Lon protease-like protein